MTDNEHKDDHSGGHHVPPAWIFHAVFVTLLVMTAVTVFAASVDMGRTANILVAMAIATFKASLVCAFFMHLRWDKPFNTVILLVSLLFVGLFLGLSTLDTAENEWRKDPTYGEKKMALARTQKKIVYHSNAASGGAASGGDVAGGMALFRGAAICAACHGQNAEGQPGLGKNLPESPFVKGLDDAALIAFLKKGRAADDPANTTKIAMPPVSPTLTDAQLQSIVDYIRSLQH